MVRMQLGLTSKASRYPEHDSFSTRANRLRPAFFARNGPSCSNCGA